MLDTAAWLPWLILAVDGVVAAPLTPGPFPPRKRRERGAFGR